jgi:hypothetical protein
MDRTTVAFAATITGSAWPCVLLSEHMAFDSRRGTSVRTYYLLALSRANPDAINTVGAASECVEIRGRDFSTEVRIVNDQPVDGPHQSSMSFCFKTTDEAGRAARALAHAASLCGAAAAAEPF